MTTEQHAVPPAQFAAPQPVQQTTPAQQLVYPGAAEPAPAPVEEPPGHAAAAQELEASGDYVVVPLCGVPVRVLMSPRWRASHMRMLTGGDTDGFMAAILEDDGYEVYLEADPDQEEHADFMDAVAQASKEALGKSGGRGRSSRTTRRR